MYTLSFREPDGSNHKQNFRTVKAAKAYINDQFADNPHLFDADDMDSPTLTDISDLELVEYVKTLNKESK